jgi:hypothetical protein
MARLGDPALHFYMTRGIARMLDVNLGDALREGRLSPETYAEMVTRCRGCDHADRCKAMLANTVDLASPPTHCPNDASFRSLRVH